MEKRIEDSFIKIPRGFTKWPYYQNPNVKAVFIDLLINACWNPTPVDDIIVGHGQYAISYGRLSEHCGITYEQARGAIQKLKAIKEITYYRRRDYIVITILNYHLYTGKYDVCEDKGNIVTNHIPNTSQQINKDNNIDYTKNIFGIEVANGNN